MLRIFLDPWLDALGKLGSHAYMPLLRTDRCLQLLVRLLHSCVPRGSGAQDGEDEWLAGGAAVFRMRGLEFERVRAFSCLFCRNSRASI